MPAKPRRPAGGPRILVANDDGIAAPGLAVLERIAHAMSDDVWVVAPETEQSGAAHSLTINEPLRLRKIAERRFAVHGTPTDCVMLAVYHLLRGEKRPDLLLSGVNAGANLGEDVTYSGTVAAAIEGALLGIRSIAFSQVGGLDGPMHWETAARHGPEVIRRLEGLEWLDGVLINVNFPSVSPEKVTGIEATLQGQRDTGDLLIDQRTDMRGIPYFWIGFRQRIGTPASDTDFAAVARGAVSVTQLRVNLSDAETRDRLSAILR